MRPMRSARAHAGLWGRGANRTVMPSVGSGSVVSAASARTDRRPAGADAPAGSQFLCTTRSPWPGFQMVMVNRPSSCSIDEALVRSPT